MLMMLMMIWKIRMTVLANACADSHDDGRMIPMADHQSHWTYAMGNTCCHASKAATRESAVSRVGPGGFGVQARTAPITAVTDARCMALPTSR